MPLGQETLPLVGELEESGLTTHKVRNVRTNASMLTNPQVTVIVRHAKNDAGVGVGEIANPGSYPSGKPTTVVRPLTRKGCFQ
jgi:protein involved in polysaccharide export with SLBB domain